MFDFVCSYVRIQEYRNTPKWHFCGRLTGVCCYHRVLYQRLDLCTNSVVLFRIRQCELLQAVESG
jgi:hypothetical protein